jgi:hypothetical protein
VPIIEYTAIIINKIIPNLRLVKKFVILFSILLPRWFDFYIILNEVNLIGDIPLKLTPKFLSTLEVCPLSDVFFHLWFRITKKLVISNDEIIFVTLLY